MWVYWTGHLSVSFLGSGLQELAICTGLRGVVLPIWLGPFTCLQPLQLGPAGLRRLLSWMTWLCLPLTSSGQARCVLLAMARVSERAGSEGAACHSTVFHWSWQVTRQIQGVGNRSHLLVGAAAPLEKISVFHSQCRGRLQKCLRIILPPPFSNGETEAQRLSWFTQGYEVEKGIELKGHLSTSSTCLQH